MELFESNQPYPNQQQTTLPVEPEPRYQPATAVLPAESNQHGHAWIHTIGLILLGLVLVVAFVLLARWAYHRTHHHASTSGSSKVATTTKTTASNEASRPKTSSTSSSSASSSSNASSAAPSSSATSSTSSSTGTSKITNTGPGNVVGLFVGTSLAAAGLHFVISLRRFNRAKA